ncbi:dihydroorotase [Mesohalobacter halotolerans]|uniref:Dihydroorotase n=1 Tax=Mesohalobacter halotolerans TaxID=1883405 RepID=A0A4V6ALN0_9FLAO|nr:dihydroorotase [Mesohalobacter halotolerans]MBS3737553.1 dihydroorotase [Psychroflexus sp.]TKS57325.1 dihydroorotase [Mesohalobacter halotolerans]
MMAYLIKNAQIVNEQNIFTADVLIDNGSIQRVDSNINVEKNHQLIDAKGQFLIPGAIDDQVHFREPGLTHKETIKTGSLAAVAGGITSFMEMPNTNPQTVTQELLEEKFAMAAKSSYANYSFKFGGTNNNLDEIKKINPKTTAGLKLFLGSSTGNMLVDDWQVLEDIFKHSPVIISTHCEDEDTIKRNTEIYKAKYGEDIPIKYHPKIRSEEACYLSSSRAVELAKQTDARLHVFHLSTAKETHLFDSDIPLDQKQVTSEVCIHHLWFSDEDYDEKGTHIKWNPAIKTAQDRDELLKALLDNRIDVLATDHAPHTLEEKSQVYTQAPSGGPLVQHALPALLEFYHQGKIRIEDIVQKFCHNPALLFDVDKRGFIREGYKADLVLLNTKKPWTISKDNLLYKCGWSPFEGTSFQSQIEKTFVNGELIYDNFKFNDIKNAERLEFDR